MTDTAHSFFQNKKVSFEKLVEYGFEPDDKGNYVFCKTLTDSGFILTVTISQEGDVSTQVTDPEFGEPYTLHLSDIAQGTFVGNVRKEYDDTLNDIAQSCFITDVFKTAQAKQLIKYVRKTYGDELEYLWQKFPDNAIWRRKDNKKWYAAILTVSRRKLGLDSNEIAEIIDLRYPPDKMAQLVDNKRYFPGWHMNKKNWLTIVLDGTVDISEIQNLIDQSYTIANK